MSALLGLLSGSQATRDIDACAGCWGRAACGLLAAPGAGRALRSHASPAGLFWASRPDSVGGGATVGAVQAPLLFAWDFSTTPSPRGRLSVVCFYNKPRSL